MKFTLKIETGNDAMQTSSDVASALRRIADRIDSSWISGDSGSIHDENGNTVGGWEMTE